ncbi:hypothetical protein KDW_11480 [Dictyobacter vulcani]|uniref:FHA domain-containing protein n=1 Tax=Dictyobacter vulcani TaxID=2607529 RepID=A0A5J4KP42_9CHLR|nr:FHA domain-containing protein [Dictyobacter vulcani]GER86986.1 hypothetical protein KDW_11480 [Dictyobacter vulcani]
MREPYLMTFAFTILASLVTPPVIVGAIIAIAVILGIGGVFVLRSNKKKPGTTPGAANSASDWQRQAQPGGAGGWNPQSSASNWNQQQQQQGQAQNSWGGAQGMPQQQSANANPWGTPNPSQAAWGNNPSQQSAQPANPWGNNPTQQPEQPANPWGNPAQPAANQPWGSSNPSQAAWGNQGNQPTPWDAAPAPAPQTQDNWNQPQSGSGPQWGAPANPAAQQQQAPTAWGQPQQQQQQQADPWGAQPKQPNPASAPSWQPNQGGFGQQDPTAMYGNNVDNDKTMLRPQGPQGMAQPGSVGFVRVEEGKEPGRIYEIRKESLSMGRSRESDIFLEDLAVSRLHASLVNMGNGSYALKDEGSANGTKVNGQLVNKFQTYPLQEGDRIQLGQTVLVFAKK